MRRSIAICALLTLAACASDQPAGGVGFDNYVDYAAERSAREADLRDGIPPRLVISPESRGRIATPSGALPPPPLDPNATQVAGATPPPPGDVIPSNPRISDEQNFDAVSGRESIESDRQRLERQRQQYEIVQPTAVPRRPSDLPNIVAYAIESRQAVGQKIYDRGAFASAERAARRCAGYVSPDRAQEAFMAAGGPERDRMGLDPDGDGFACGWDPTPFRRAAR